MIRPNDLISSIGVDEYFANIFSSFFPDGIGRWNLDERGSSSSAGRTRGVFDEESYVGCEKFRAISD